MTYKSVLKITAPLWTGLLFHAPSFASGTFSPTAQDSTKLEYDLSRNFKNDGVSIDPNDEIQLVVPKSYFNKSIDFVYITHKQKPDQLQQNCGGDSKTDCIPAYTSFEVMPSVQASLSQEWRCWGGVGSGPCHSKFAEIRSYEGETDNLYEWYTHGYVKTSSPGIKEFAPLKPQAFRVRSLGQDTVWVQKVVVKFSPSNLTHKVDHIFSNGLNFGDWLTASGRRYPGHADVGDYGRAIRLSKTNKYYQIDSDKVVLETDGLHIRTNVTDRLSFIDIACGDMKPVPPGEDPDDYRGNGKLSVEIRTAHHNFSVMVRENVGSNGVMRALIPEELTQEPVEEVFISGRGSQISIMGVRLGFE